MAFLFQQSHLVQRCPVPFPALQHNREMLPSGSMAIAIQTWKMGVVNQIVTNICFRTLAQRKNNLSGPVGALDQCHAMLDKEKFKCSEENYAWGQQFLHWRHPHHNHLFVYHHKKGNKNYHCGCHNVASDEKTTINALEANIKQEGRGSCLACSRTQWTMQHYCNALSG